jgi:hypothetical protein
MRAALQQCLVSPAMSDVLQYYTVAEHLMALLHVLVTQANRPLGDQLVLRLLDTLSTVYMKQCQIVELFLSITGKRIFNDIDCGSF